MAADDLPKRYDPAEAEPRILRRWLASGLFHPAPEGTAAENYSVAIPPPNITGSLHMGHALNHSIQDVLVRWHRMRGQRTKWILGTDHAGIATQTQVDRQLRLEGSSREQLGREAFVERVWAWREQYGSRIVSQIQRMGQSCDYDEERFTLDERYHRAVITVFVELYRKGLIYRDRYLVNWDPGTRSAISDLEVEDREVTDTLYSIAYPLADGDGEVVVATVRPETMLADTAVAVHPDDDRYRALVGREVLLPLVGRRLEVIADDYVKPEFGTGALKITPGHDPNDFEIGRRHGLESFSVIGEDGRLTAAAGERFAGLTTTDARRAVVAALRAERRIVTQEPYVHSVPHSHRSGERIEPLISLQWFMRMELLARPAIDVVTSGRVRFHPGRWTRVYLDWMENIRPWCISRQLWWGHRLPVYYCADCGQTHVAPRAPARCPACGGRLTQDPDVLDTWFSSALWPFATLGWPEQTPQLRAFYPTDALVTARDIIFLWVARMVMMGLEFRGEIPFSDVYITSVIQAPDGRRMSKSLGTGIDPLDEIQAHGADAVRFGLLAMSSTQDVRYSREKVAQGQQLATKLFNASRLVLGRVRDDVAGDWLARPPAAAALEDRWVLSRLQRAIERTTSCLEAWDFSHVALGLYDFVYGELCDWYLEWIKPRLYEQEPGLDAFALHVIGQTLALAHPVIPFVTEAVYATLPGSAGRLLAAGPYPVADPARCDPAAERVVGRAIAAIQALRGWREQIGSRPGDRLPARLAADGYDGSVEGLGRLARLDWVQRADEPVASIAVPGGAVLVYAAAGLDLEVAARRAAQRRERLQAELRRAEGKLSNPGFVAKAPAAVVEAERAKAQRLRADLDAQGQA